MAFFDRLRKRRKRPVNVVARELADVVFALHPAAAGNVLVQLTAHGGRPVVSMMEVTATDPSRPAASVPDRAAAYAKANELIAELANVNPRGERTITVMRDRVAWMPSVFTFQPPV